LGLPSVLSPVKEPEEILSNTSPSLSASPLPALTITAATLNGFVEPSESTTLGFPTKPDLIVVHVVFLSMVRFLFTSYFRCLE